MTTLYSSVKVNISRKYYDFHLNRYRKCTFQDFSNINSLGIKFGLEVKKKVKDNSDPSFVQSCKPGRAIISNNTYQVPRPLAFWF